jgi:predicted phosphoribosyltransferase
MSIPTRFWDRTEAGRSLARELKKYAGRPDVLVLGLPRGGVPVAHEVAQALDVPLDVYVVRKLGVPGREEFAMGALGSGGVRVLNTDVIASLGIPDDVIESVANREAVELARRETVFRHGRPPLEVHGRTVILVDDGVATGATLRAAILGLRKAGAERIVAAVPVASASAADLLRDDVDEFIAISIPPEFHSVGEWYDRFPQTTDREVSALLDNALDAHPLN